MGIMQKYTPLLDALKKYSQKGYLSFHMPGHKGGRGTAARLLETIGPQALRLDLTEVPGLDDLHQPTGVIAQAQELAAAAFGGDETFFLVNGSTAGLEASLLACLNPGDAVLLPRDIHQSVLSGLILVGARPVFLPPKVDPLWGIPLPPTAADVARSLAAHPEVRALLLVSPTYNGLVADLKESVELGHQRGLPVIVDEAHGPHFLFHPGFPPSALWAGADLVVQGLHKVGGSLTQSSLLHRQGERVSPERLKKALALVQTTSPSYLLLASLDAARMFLATEGPSRWARALQLATSIRQRLAALAGLDCLTAEEVRAKGPFQLDPTRLTISARQMGLSGLALADLLRRDFRIEVETADFLNVIALITPGDDEESVESLARALEAISRQAPDSASLLPKGEGVATQGASFHVELDQLELPQQVLLPREAFFRLQRRVPLGEAVGQIAGGFIAPYPPGVPLIYPGEAFSRQLVEFLLEMRGKGLRFHGMYREEDATVDIIVAES